MKGFVSVIIPTKSYIKAYVINQLGDWPKMTTRHEIGNKMYDFLAHKTNERKTEFSNKRYNATMKVFISVHTYRQRGCYLNETNIKNFNLFLEKKIKHLFYHYMDHYIDILPNFEANLPEIRRKLCIDIEAWSDDSIKKDYYRYRKMNNKPLLYQKTFTRTVPSDSFANLAF